MGSIIVKAHPGHAETSGLVANAIMKAAANCNMPVGIFAHVYGADISIGEALVKHQHTKAVGFTGSFAGGKQLFDWGNQRKEPIPVFAEMSSVNPVFIMPEKNKISASEIAKMLAASISLSAGQFCTSPGIIIGIAGEDLDLFTNILSEELKEVAPAAMLNSGIYNSYLEKKEKALSQDGVDQLWQSPGIDSKLKKSPGAMPKLMSGDLMTAPTIAVTTANNFISNSLLQQEVFGPYAIIVRCADIHEMKEVAKNLQGQLTATFMATENDIISNAGLVDIVENICGRFIFNGVPTGVEVCLAMQHGGPFPATTDSRFTSVGADGIKRFARPVTFQNWPEGLLPEELRIVNYEL